MLKGKKYVKDMSILHTMHFKRCINTVPDVTKNSYEIITFTDASKHTYAPVVYLRILNGTSRTVHLMFSKTRLAPIKGTLSIPRLELMSVLIGCRASQFVVDQLGFKGVKQRVFTDSKCVIEWYYSKKELKRFR